VASSAERAVAESIAADVPGVQDVDSRLVIERLL
jgi:osmotically-inducible protein OsmY